MSKVLNPSALAPGKSMLSAPDPNTAHDLSKMGLEAVRWC